MQMANDPYILTGARQEGLALAGQLAPGQILTGTAWRTAREVVEVRGELIILTKYPAGPVDPAHIHTLNLHGNMECACGYREQPVAGILPVREGMIRTYILTPTGPLQTPDPFTVYVSGRGRAVRVTGSSWAADNSTIPIIPKLAVAWTIPAGLRELLGR